MEKIKKITSKGTDNFGNHSYFIELESNKTGFYRCKNECTWKPGEEVDLLTEEKPKKDGSGTYTMFKLNKPDFKPFGSKKGSNASFALSYSKDVQIALIQSGAGIVSNEAEIIQRANTLLAWLNENE